MKPSQRKKTIIDWHDPDQVREYQRQYREKNKDRIRWNQHVWQVRNRKKANAYVAHSRMRKKGEDPENTPIEPIEISARGIGRFTLSNDKRLNDAVKLAMRDKYLAYHSDYAKTHRKEARKRYLKWYYIHKEELLARLKEKRKKAREQASTTHSGSSSHAE